jgi:hypothetical protein
MATLNRDNIVKASNFDIRKLNYPLSTGGSFDYQAGDLLWFDTSAGYVKPLDSDAHAAYLCGVALRPAYLGPYVGFNLAAGPGQVKNYYNDALVGIECEVSLYTTSGDTYTDGTAVYYGANAQTITSQAASHIIGYVKLPSGTAPLTNIAGSATQLVTVALTIAYPVSTF